MGIKWTKSENKYFCTKDTLRETIEKYGIAIIPNVIDKKECMDMYNGAWNFFEHVSYNWKCRVNRYNESTWTNFNQFYPSASMLFQHFNIGHSQHSWNLRQNPKIVDIFANFWGLSKNDLLVSFDGMSFLPPPEITDIGWENKPWFHMDQRLSKPNFDGIQGWITAFDVDEGDATLAFFANSHLYTEEFSKQFPEKDKENDWVLLSKEEVEFYESRCKIDTIKCPAGSLVIWDSRLVHYGKCPSRTRKYPKFRCINYLSYSPKSTVEDEQVYIDKLYGLENLLTSNHYANRAGFFKTYDNLIEYNKIDSPQLTELGRSLAGKIEM